MSTITFDFRHHYKKGERRPSEQIAYQWDLGHTAEIYVPVNATYELHYCFPDYAETDDYAIDSIAAASDGGYVITAHIPNVFFERFGQLSVYVIGTSSGQVITTYEGYITIRERIQPEDYVDDDPDNTATRIIDVARGYAETSEAYAVGKRDGTDVGSSDPAYHNNAKYYAGEASDSATSAEASATLAESYAKGGTNTRAGEETDNAKYYKEQAHSSANSAAISKDAAEAIAQSMSAQSGVSGTVRIDGVLYATYCFVENGIPYTRLSEIVET